MDKNKQDKQKMEKFKIGDKVEVIKGSSEDKYMYGNTGWFKKGEQFIIESIEPSSMYKENSWLSEKSGKSILNKFVKKISKDEIEHTKFTKSQVLEIEQITFDVVKNHCKKIRCEE